MEQPAPEDVARIARTLGWRPRLWRRAAAHRPGSANVAHWIASGADRTAFVKLALREPLATWLRTEHRNLTAIAARFMPRVLEFDDHPERPLLALEDLSDADWPPPWSDRRVAAALDLLAAVRETPAAAHLSSMEHVDGEGWERVAANPSAFLSVGLCTPDWLASALPTLREAAASAPIAGDALVHLDVRSDNLCFRNGAAILVDWNHARRANADLDVAFWLPSLHAEGGPPPESILPDAPGLAAWVAGFFCSFAGEPAIPDPPHVRPLQVTQARTALPWAARALRLPRPGG